MPQFDFYSFISQTFWILLFLGLFYFFVVFFVLTRYAGVIKFRKNLNSFYMYKSYSNKRIKLYDSYISQFFV